MHLAARLRELEAEADTVRAELAEMDNLASQTEAAIYRLLSSVLAGNQSALRTLRGIPAFGRGTGSRDEAATYPQPGPAADPRCQYSPLILDTNTRGLSRDIDPLRRRSSHGDSPRSSPDVRRFPSFAAMSRPSAIALWIAPSRKP